MLWLGMKVQICNLGMMCSLGREMEVEGHSETF